MQKTIIKNDIDFNIPDRAELITRQKPDTSVGGLSFGFELMYTENSAEGLPNGEDSKWKKLQDAYQEELANPIKVLLTKFFDHHPEIIPIAYVSTGYTTDIEGYMARAQLYQLVNELN